MSWSVMLDVIRAEAGIEVAGRVEQRILSKLRGARVTIGVRAPLTDAEVQHALRANGWNVTKAAEALGVAPSIL
jgi:hypothetical protein